MVHCHPHMPSSSLSQLHPPYRGFVAASNNNNSVRLTHTHSIFILFSLSYLTLLYFSTVVYVSYNTRLDKNDDSNKSRFKSSLCAVNLDDYSTSSSTTAAAAAVSTSASAAVAAK